MLDVGVAAIGDTGCRACLRLVRALFHALRINYGGYKMKRKLLMTLLCIMLAAGCAFGFSACDNRTDDEADDPIVTPTPDDENPAAHEHNYSAWEVERAATCTADGLQVRVCQTCGHEETQTLSMLWHDIIEHAGQAATCKQAGWEAYETCTRCDYTTYVTIPELGHDIIEHAGQAATCTQEGWEAYEACSRCDYTTYQSIPELGHDIIEHAGQAATCTQAGWEAYEACSRCDYTTYKAILAQGHSYQDGVCVQCQKEDPRYNHQWEAIGEDTYVCDSCGAIAKNDATQWEIEADMFSNISSTGLTITMNTSDVINDWNAFALMSGQHNAIISLPNLDPWNMVTEGMTEEEEKIASTLTRVNFFPLASDLFNGGRFDSFYNIGEELSFFTTIVIEPGETGGISYYRDGVLLVRYAYDRINSYSNNNSGSAGDYVKLFLMLVERTGLIVAQRGVTATNAVVYLEALKAREVAALAEYNLREGYYPLETVNLSKKTIDNMDDYTIFIVPNKYEETLIRA